ncbi:hypothetical protein AF72_09405 [Xylella taiwanensis]|uniref:Uncharacterized protein n=1 Tax=Xylella taiwanensis TaxID=1444770 RepID=Z9JH53_9GAMM|nr:hypothetical protein AF72_09405 [Xylella taiwanensis]
MFEGWVVIIKAEEIIRKCSVDSSAMGYSFSLKMRKLIGVKMRCKAGVLICSCMAVNRA